VLYVTAETFTNEMVAAIRTHATDDFRARYRQVDVLLVDDVQFMAGKTKTEEEFYHTFNAIFARGGQIVIASNQSPRRLENLDDRLRSRFEGGLMADIQSPQFETRLAILRSKSQAQGATLPDEVAGLLARPATENVRELEGMLTQLIARATLSQQPITLALAEQVLNQSSDQPRRRTTNLDRILEATATYHQLSLDDLLSKRRTKDIVRARQIAMYLAREETEASYPQIGRALGGRNHSTVVYGYQKIAGQVEEDPDLRQHVSDLRRQIYLFSKD
jgi:chromosomal replication initiator protein